MAHEKIKKIKLIALLSLTWLVTGFSDPTKPPEVIKEAKKAYTLKATVTNNGTQRALIDSIWVTEGDLIDNYTVTEIKDKTVTLKYKNRTKILHLIDMTRPILPQIKKIANDENAS